MFFKLLKLEWKSFFRSASLGKGIAIRLLMGFLSLYFLLCFLLLGIGLYFVIVKEFPQEEPILFVNNYLLYWFLGEFIVRFLLQNLPTLSVKPLLTQRISRNKIIHFLLFKSFYSFFNVLSLAVALPFVIVNLKETEYTAVQLISWFMAVMGFVYFVNYLNIWIQKKYAKGLKTLLPFIAFVLILWGLEYTGTYSISSLFGVFFSYILAYPILGIVPVILAVAMYRYVFVDLKENLYLDSYMNTKEKNGEFAELNWVDKFGSLAPFIRLDIKLIMRNKRAKSTVLLSLFFICYGLIFYPNPSFKSSSYMLVFVGIFMTGIFVINFGQFIPAWDSTYFPLFRTRAISTKRYLESKVVLMYCSVLILTTLSCGYVYFGIDKLYLNLACGMYNLGVNIPLILVFSAYNRKRIDLSQGSMFNYQGIGMAQWLVGIPLFLIPLMIWGAVSFLTSQTTANCVLASIGLIGLLLHKVIISAIADLYVENRYKMIEGFKQKG